MWAAAVQSNVRISPEVGEMYGGVIPLLDASVRLLVKKSRFWCLKKIELE